jgi:stage V sporulation protein AD
VAVGPEEGAGPLQDDLDIIYPDLEIGGQSSWERSERELLSAATHYALRRAQLSAEDIHFYTGGDLLNQIVSSTFTLRELAIPFIGVYGACSTSMEGLALAALMIDSGNATYAMTGTCSHNCTVEKQFRYPTEYGSQKPPTAQYTMTGAGACVLGSRTSGAASALLTANDKGANPILDTDAHSTNRRHDTEPAPPVQLVVTHATIGTVTDLGIKDPMNMGAAMAPAAVDTITHHFNDTGRVPADYDLIVTGDLASVGLPIAQDLFARAGIPMEHTTFTDCGVLIYNVEELKDKVWAGGSGAGCSAVVTYGHIFKRMLRGELRRVLIVATGALLSPLTSQQGESVPCIAHAVAVEALTV